MPVRSTSVFETDRTASHDSLGGAKASERAVVSLLSRVNKERKSEMMVDVAGTLGLEEEEEEGASSTVLLLSEGIEVLDSGSERSWI